MGTITYAVLKFFVPEYNDSNHSSLIAAGVAGAASLLAKFLVPDRPRLKD